jgi:ribosome-binding protein aMBF1 (putative translation factor)
MAKPGRRKRTSDARTVLARITGDDPKLEATIAKQKVHVRIAEAILAVREAAGVTQAQLAKLVGTSQSVISRLEDADYEGRSLTILQRIAAALHHRVEIRLVPL